MESQKVKVAPPDFDTFLNQGKIVPTLTTTTTGQVAFAKDDGKHVESPIDGVLKQGPILDDMMLLQQDPEFRTGTFSDKFSCSGPLDDQKSNEVKDMDLKPHKEFASDSDKRMPRCHWGRGFAQGMRSSMEDAHAVEPLYDLGARFFGVYDGHGGSDVAHHCRNRVHLALAEELGRLKKSSEDRWVEALAKSFLRVDSEVAQDRWAKMGSTAICAVITDTHIIIANCGDSRAVLCRGKQAINLSEDHKPNRVDERERIESAGGLIVHWHGDRVFGVLAMTRSIGDHEFKPWIIADPEVMSIQRRREDRCLILATDGLWDVMTSQVASDLARRVLLSQRKSARDGAALPSGDDQAAQAAAEYLTRRALQKGSEDNVTVLVIDLY